MYYRNPIKIMCTKQALSDTPAYAKSISLLDIGLSIGEVAKRIGILRSIVRRLKCCHCPRNQHKWLDS
jgi:uncharacterized small protein (DUF1192 family)